MRKRIEEEGVFKIVGVGVAADLLRSWGVFLIVGLQLYFLMCMRVLNGRTDLLQNVSFSTASPWLAMQTGPPAMIYILSVSLLPIVTTIAVVRENLALIPLWEFITYWHSALASIAVVCLSFLLIKEQANLRDAVGDA